MHLLNSIDHSNFFEVLPGEIVDKIFSYLPQKGKLNLLNTSRFFNSFLPCLIKEHYKIHPVESLDLPSERISYKYWVDCVKSVKISKTLLNGCSSLKDFTRVHTLILDLEAGRQVIAETLKALSENCGNIKTFDLNGLTKDLDLEIIALNCPHLTTVKLRSCLRITDAGIQALAKKCPHLNRIEISKCKQVTDAGIKALIENRPHLFSIDLTNDVNHTLGNRTLNILLEKEKSLETLILWGNHGVTCVEFETSLKECLSLTHLDLSLCIYLKDEGLKTLLKRCPNLTHIALEACDITDEALSYFTPYLKEVNLRHSGRVTEIGIEALVKSTPYLRTLDLREAAKFTEIEIKALRSKFPKLVILWES